MAERDPATERYHAALRRIADPAGGEDIVTAGLVDSLQAKDGLVHVALRTDRAHAAAMEGVAKAAQAALRALPGVLNATVVLTAHRPAPAAQPAAQPPETAAARFLPGVRHVIAVASGKGGVGKSTVAINLAIAFARMGLATGLIDADIYGPSLPRMLGVTEKPGLREKTMLPVRAWGLSCMSIGLLVPETQAMVWRGPMIMGALTQMLGQTDWGTLDVMVVDLPPGTGDAQLTLSQRCNLAGAVIVSTPQDIALIDARRGIAMFGKVGVKVLGIVENMSFFACPACGHRAEIFGHGGARDEAAKLGVPFLGEIPLLLEMRQAGDAGTPILASAPHSEGARALAAVADAIAANFPGLRATGARPLPHAQSHTTYL